uniref:Coiled-coil domain containing 28B n=1 Tax=Sus scrofa TaxID=9823 RepID=A0A8D1W7U9_PIG
MTSTQAGCRPSERNAPLSSWSTCGRCRRSWPGCTSAWTCVGRKRKRRKKRTGSLRGCQRSRRRPWLTATWTSCSAIWKILVILYRSCTWPRTPSLRSHQLCSRRTQAQTAPSHSFKTVTFYELDWMFRGPPPGAMGEGELDGIKPERSKRLLVLLPLIAPLLGRGG